MATVNKAANSTNLADKLNKQFPYLYIGTDTSEKYPEFTSLLTALTSYITSEGLTSQTSKDLQQAEEVLRHEKHSWLLNHILYLEVQELVLDYEIRSLEISLSSRDEQFFKTLQECLTQAELEDYLDFSPDPSSKVTSLGLTKEDLDRQNPYKKHMSSLQQALIPEIEERLRKKCENLLITHDLENSTDSTKLLFAKSSQLPALIETDKHHLEEAKVSLKQERRRTAKQLQSYCQTLMDSLELLETLISRYKLRNQAEHDTITSEWLYAQCDAMCLKIKIVELQLLCDTYTIETQQSLQVIRIIPEFRILRLTFIESQPQNPELDRKHLDSAVADSEKEKQHRIQAIKAYESVGNGFDNIVLEYGKFKDELENKQWALAEFDKSERKT